MYQVGDKLWYVSNSWGRHSGHQYEVVVTKVGHKWVYVKITDSSYPSEFRIDPKTMDVDGRGYTPPGKCYPSKEVYEEDVYSNRLLDELRNKLSDYRLRKIESKNVIQAAKLLGYTLQAEKQNGTSDPGPS